MRKASWSYGRLADEIRVEFESFKNSLQGKLFGLLFLLIAMQCYNSLRNPFQSAFFKYCLF